MKSNDFDKIANVYDPLAKLVFGRSIREAQKYFLYRIPEHSNVLILGGGTGWILQELFKIQNDVMVCYIEASAKMIEIAKGKSGNDKRVTFIYGTETDIPSNTQFDVVITNFYLDLFTDESLKTVLNKIEKRLAPAGYWIATDFIENKWWQKLMLRVMYFFFRITCSIESQKLPRWKDAMQVIGLKQVDSKRFYRGFIETSLFQF